MPLTHDDTASDTATETTGELRWISGEWRDQANCKGQLHLFFGKTAERPQARRRREAKAAALCDACPVVEPCRDYARETTQYGFWGGESELDRYLLGYTVTAPIGIRSAEYGDAVSRRSA